MAKLETALASVIQAAAQLRREFNLGDVAPSPAQPLSEMHFESLHIVEFLLILSEHFGEAAIERLEFDPEMTFAELADQLSVTSGPAPSPQKASS